jgi:hypothetical protein
MQLVENRALTGELETVVIEDVGDKRIFHYAQQTGYILNDNERMRRENPDWDRNSELRQVAAIPDIVWNLWESMGITMDQKELRKAIMRHRDEYMVVEKNLI